MSTTEPALDSTDDVQTDTAAGRPRGTSQDQAVWRFTDRRTIVGTAGAISPVRCHLDVGHHDLPHGPAMARFDPGSDWRVRIGLQTGKLYRDHLPGDAEPVFEPTVLTWLTAFGDEPVHRRPSVFRKTNPCRTPVAVSHDRGRLDHLRVAGDRLAGRLGRIDASGKGWRDRWFRGCCLAVQALVNLCGSIVVGSTR